MCLLMIFVHFERQFLKPPFLSLRCCCSCRRCNVQIFENKFTLVVRVICQINLSASVLVKMQKKAVAFLIFFFFNLF